MRQKINHFHLTISFDDQVNFVFHDFYVIVNVLDVTFEDVFNNIVFETQDHFSVESIKSNKLEYEFDVSLENHNKIYTIFVLVDIDKNGKISIGDYISMDRHVLTPNDKVHNISIKVYKVIS